MQMIFQNNNQQHNIAGEHSHPAIHIHRVRHVDAARTATVRGGRRTRTPCRRRRAARRPAGWRAAHHDAEHRRCAAEGSHTLWWDCTTSYLTLYKNCQVHLGRGFFTDWPWASSQAISQSNKLQCMLITRCKQVSPGRVAKPDLVCGWDKCKIYSWVPSEKGTYTLIQKAHSVCYVYIMHSKLHWAYRKT